MSVHISDEELIRLHFKDRPETMKELLFSYRNGSKKLMILGLVKLRKEIYEHPHPR